MKLLIPIWNRIRSLAQRRAMKREIDEELRFHIEQRTAENIAAGMTPDEAAREARRRFGNVQSVREVCHDIRGAGFGDTAVQDIRFGLRLLRRNPGFTTVVVLTLALGIGANTAIFSTIRHVLLKPLPYEDSDRLVMVWEKPVEQSEAYVAGGVFLDWEEHTRTFEELSIIGAGTFMNLSAEGEPERLRGWSVSSDLLRTLRVQPIFGRGFLSEEEKPGFQNKVVLLGYDLWQRRFGADINIIGRLIRLDGYSYTVIGVLPREALPFLRGAMNPTADFLVPLVLGSEPWHRDRSVQSFNVVGRLRAGVSMDQAQGELSDIQRRLSSRYPKDKEHWGALVEPLSERTHRTIRPTLLLMLGAAACVLLIACANVSSLMLARALVREREIATRMALGAGRWRIARQFLTESVLVALLGGGGGLLLAYASLRTILPMARDSAPYMGEVPLDGQVLLFSLLVSSVCGIVFGILPALRSSLPVRNAAPNSRQRFRGALIVSQIAGTVVLLIGTGLLLRSLFFLLNAPLGFVPEHTLGMDLTMSAHKYPDDHSRLRFYDQLFERLHALPGVVGAGSASLLPMTGGSLGCSVTIEGRMDRVESGYTCGFEIVGGQYFRAMGIPILRGRDFRTSDAAINATRVCIINEALGDSLFPNKDPLGQRIGFNGAAFEIIGVARSVRHYRMDQDRPDERLYVPQFSPGASSSLIIRTTGEPLVLAGTIRNAILSVDPDQPISNVRTLEQAIERSISGRRLALLLLGILAGLALLISVVGLYGLVAFTATRRTKEMGIRIALGAQRREILWLIVGYGLKLVLPGLALGMIAALAFTRLLRNMLFEVKPVDPTTFGFVMLLLLSVALFACWLPARRATRVNPMVALRCE